MLVGDAGRDGVDALSLLPPAIILEPDAPVTEKEDFLDPNMLSSAVLTHLAINTPQMLCLLEVLGATSGTTVEELMSVPSSAVEDRHR